MVAVYIDGNAVYTPGRGSPPDFDDYKSEDFAAVELVRGWGDDTESIQRNGIKLRCSASLATNEIASIESAGSRSAP